MPMPELGQVLQKPVGPQSPFTPAGNKVMGCPEQTGSECTPGPILGPLAVGSRLSTVLFALAVLSILNNPARNELNGAYRGVPT